MQVLYVCYPYQGHSPPFPVFSLPVNVITGILAASVASYMQKWNQTYFEMTRQEKKKKKKQVHDDQGETFDSCFATCDYFSVVDTTTATGRDPKDVARAVVKAVRHKSKDVVLAGLLPTAAIYLRTLWPALFFKLMSSRARKEQKAKNT